MAKITRVLDPEPVRSLDDYRSAGGGRGLEAGRKLGPAATIDEIEASGLRGRGGAGFPTARKWAAVASNRAPGLRPSVVVNASEGEPGSFKDRMLMRRNPYRIIEGAVIAAEAVDAERVVFALKASFTQELERLRTALAEVEHAGWTELTMSVVEGPSEYLYGEETALLEVVDGRAPFPRIAPPYRHGVDDVGDDPTSAAGSVMATPGGRGEAAPALVNNAETIANVPGILAEGAAWFRQAGTDESPGTIVCTVSGGGRRAGVARVRDGHTAVGGHRDHRRAGRAGQGGAVGGGQPLPSRGRSSTRRSATPPWRPPAPASERPGSSSSPTRRTSPRSPPAWPGSWPSSPAASARPASRTGWPSPTS